MNFSYYQNKIQRSTINLTLFNTFTFIKFIHKEEAILEHKHSTEHYTTCTHSMTPDPCITTLSDKCPCFSCFSNTQLRNSVNMVKEISQNDHPIYFRKLFINI